MMNFVRIVFFVACVAKFGSLGQAAPVRAPNPSKTLNVLHAEVEVLVGGKIIDESAERADVVSTVVQHETTSGIPDPEVTERISTQDPVTSEVPAHDATVVVKGNGVTVEVAVAASSDATVEPELENSKDVVTSSSVATAAADADADTVITEAPKEAGPESKATATAVPSGAPAASSTAPANVAKAAPVVGNLEILKNEGAAPFSAKQRRIRFALKLSGVAAVLAVVVLALAVLKLTILYDWEAADFVPKYMKKEQKHACVLLNDLPFCYTTLPTAVYTQ